MKEPVDEFSEHEQDIENANELMIKLAEKLATTTITDYELVSKIMIN